MALQDLENVLGWPADCGAVAVNDSTLNRTETGGTPYGPSHVAGSADDKPISTDEAALCRVLGARLATAAEALRKD